MSLLPRLSARAIPVVLLLALATVGNVVQFAHAGHSRAATSDQPWSKRFGDSAGQGAYSVAVDGAGDVTLTGWLSGTVDFGGGPLTSAGVDIFVAKLDRAGNHLWSKRFGDADYPSPPSVAVDGTGNVLIAGAFEGTVDFGGGPLTSAGNYDIFLAKFDSSGNHLWSKRFGDAGWRQEATSIAIDGAGDVILTGFFAGTIDFGGGPLTGAGDYDIFLAKFDGDGNHLWSERFGDSYFQSAYSVSVDVGGDVLIAGVFEGAVDFGGGPMTSAGSTDIFLAKFDPSGNHLWSRRFGDSIGQGARSVAVDGTGNVLMVGDPNGTVDFGGGPLTSEGVDTFVAKFDGAGNHLWSKLLGEAGAITSGTAVAVDGVGDVVLTGSFGGTVDFGGGPLTSAGVDIFVAEFSGAGDHLWSRRFGDAYFQSANSVAVDGAGKVFIVGDFEGTVDFGGGPLTSAGFHGAGYYDIFVAGFGGGDVADADGDGCSDGRELRLTPPVNPLDPWDFYSVPVPALFAAPDPLVVFKNGGVTPADAQAVFAYFKKMANSGTLEYDQDLNFNGVRDGVEYDRSFVAAGISGAPDGVISAADAQLAFVQFRLGYDCSWP